MSLDLSLGTPQDYAMPKSFSILVDNKHKLIKLKNVLDWKNMIQVVLPDLQKTSGRFWHLGRKLYVRQHLGAYVLQALFKMTDRETEQRIRDTPVFQVFCGYGEVEKFHTPDHTKIEDFRNRLSSETTRLLVVEILKQAHLLGLVRLDSIDIDSTVQEANMAYPSDACLMRKLASKAAKVGGFLKEKGINGFQKITVDLSKVSKKGREYFFRKKNAAIEVTREIFKDYFDVVQEQVTPVIQEIEALSAADLSVLPWNIRKHVDCLKIQAPKYFQDVAYFVTHHTVKAGKQLAFHLNEVACIAKGKIGKSFEFGRVFQLARLGGNFITVFSSTDTRMNDKDSLVPIIEQYAEDFGADTLKEISTDKGYYSSKNVITPTKRDQSINTDGVQRPQNAKNQPSGARVEELRRRRAGIEPLIGHVKSFGLRKSKAKSDQGALASGYRSVLGFNLHQMQAKLAS
jgi:hypothetical protein